MTKAIIKTLLSKVLNTPLIVDEGTSGSWQYRKWSNGIAECWYDTWGNSGTFTAWGSLYYRDIDGPTFPSGLFVNTPTCLVTPYGSQADVFGFYGVSSSGINKVRFIHNNASAEASYCNIYARGRWKNVGGVVSRLLNTLQSLTLREVIAW